MHVASGVVVGGAAGRDACVGAAPRAARGPVEPVTLALVVPVGRAMRLSQPRGARLVVGAGRVWVTQSGRSEDRFVGAGDWLDVVDAGVLVLESDGVEPALVHLCRAEDAPATSQPGPLRRRLAALRAKLRGWNQRRALRGLDDRLLADIGAPVALRRSLAAERAAADAAWGWRRRMPSDW